MRFQENHAFRFTYSDEALQHQGLAESGLTVNYWDADTQQWAEAANVTVDPETNTASFSSNALNNYYVLAAPATVTSVEPSATAESPSTFVLKQNYPNPFNPATTIEFKLATRSDARLTVHNLLGQRVALLLNEPREAGSYAVSWNGRDDAGRQVSSGIYLVRLTVGNHFQVRRVTLLK